MALSRAGSLLQGIVVGQIIGGHRRTNVGVSLLAKAVCRATSISDRQLKARKHSLSGLPVSKDRNLRQLLHEVILSRCVEGDLPGVAAIKTCQG